jgi:hypothetical protein
MTDPQFAITYWIAVAAVIGAVWLPALLATVLTTVRTRAAHRTAAAREIAAAADIPADTDRDVLQQLEAMYRLPAATRRNTRTEDPR